MGLPGASMRRDLLSAYLSVAARVLAWVVVSAVVYRYISHEAFALLALVRATAGLLAYTSLGLGPAMVRMLAEAEAPKPVIPVAGPAAGVAPPGVAPPELPVVESRHPGALAYEPPAGLRPDDPFSRVYFSGLHLAQLLGFVTVVLACLYAVAADWIHEVHPAVAGDATLLALTFGAGLGLRFLSDAPGSVLQVRGRLATDNLIVAFTDASWATLSCLAVILIGPHLPLVGVAFLFTSVLLPVLRITFARRAAREAFRHSKSNRGIQLQLLRYGALLTVAQFADFLYAPVDYILINRLLDLGTVGVYAPAAQIDSALLLLVTGLSSVLLPKAAIAHAGGDMAAVRRYYLRGTAAAVALLVPAALFTWLLSPWIFRLWLGDDMAATRVILPLVLIHTVIGGSSGVGRSILLGMGKVKPFAAAALVSGVANVLLSYCFVRFGGMGLYGIILGTILAVVARAGIWMPWYVLKTLRGAEGGESRHAAIPANSVIDVG